jgi:branched-chain amino acid transport system permease protein
MALPKKMWLYGGPLLLLLAALPIGLGHHLLSFVIFALLWAYLALCFNLVFGYTGLLALGQALFLGLGAYTSTVLYTDFGISPWIGMLAGGLFSAGVAVLISLVTFRYQVRGVYFALIFMSCAEVTRNLFNGLDLAEGPAGIFLPLLDEPLNYFFVSNIAYYYIVLALLLLTLVGTYYLRRSSLGLQALAMREDEEAARAAGVDTRRTKTILLALSAFLTALGGTFYAQFMKYIQPDVVFVFAPTLEMMIGTMVGGYNTVIGPVLGSLIFSTLGEVLRSIEIPGISVTQMAAISRMIFGALLTLVVLYLPDGLFGTRWGFLRRKTAPKPKEVRTHAS